MKVTKNYVFILIILCFANQITSTISSKKFYLNENDILRLPIEEFLVYDQDISELQFKSDDQIHVDIPKPDTKLGIQLKDQSGQDNNQEVEILDSSSYENFTSKLYKDSQQKVRIMLNVFDDDQKDIEIQKIDLDELKEQNCNSIEMDDTNIYIGCYSYFKDSIILCTKNYIEQNIQIECQIVYESEQNEVPIFENEKLNLEIFTNIESTVVMMYLEKSKIEIFQDSVILYQNGMTQVMSINKQDLLIQKIQLIDFKQKLQSYSFLILNYKIENQSELFYYKYEGNKSQSSEVVSIKEKNIINFMLVESKILIFKKPQNQNLDIVQMFEFDIFSKNERIYNLENFFTDDKNFYLSKIIKYKDSAIFAMQQETSQQGQIKLVYIYYDFKNQRTNKLESNQITELSHLQQKVIIGNQNYLYIEVNNEVEIYKLNYCRYVTIQSSIKHDKTNVVFSYENNDILNVDLRYIDENQNIDFTQDTRLMHKNSLNYNPIRYYSNEPLKQFIKDISYLQQVKLEEEIYDDLDICNSHSIQIQKNILQDFCSNGVIDFHYLNLENQILGNKEIALLKKYRHKTVMPLQDITNQTIDFKMENVQEFTLIYEEIILILTKQNQLFYYNMKAQQQSLEQINIEQEVQQCHIEFNKLVCQNDEQTIVFIFEYIDTILKIKEEKIINVQNNFIAISQVKKDYIAYLIKYPDTSYYNLIGESNTKQFDVEILDKYINESTKLYEISEDNYVLITNNDGKLMMTGIKNSSIIQYPTQNIQFEQFIGLQSTQHSNYFIILHQNNDNQILFTIYNSSYQALHRLIISQVLSIEGREDINFSIQELDKTNILIHVGKKIKLSKHEFYIFRKNGPLIKNYEQNVEINYSKNESSKVIKNEFMEFESHLKIKINQLGLEKDENIVTKNLEDLSILQIDGDYVKVEQTKNQKGFIIQDRLRSIKKDFLIKDGQLIQEDFIIQSNVEQSNLSINFNRKFYKSNKISLNQSYKNCQVVQNTDLQSNYKENQVHFYLCKDMITKNFILTNFKDQNIKLLNLDQTLKPSKSYITFNQEQQFHLIISLDFNHHDIVIYEFNSKDDTYEISREYFFNSNRLNDQFEPYDNFYAYFNENEESIFMIFNSQFNLNLDIFTYDIYEKIVKLREMKRLKLIGDDRTNLLSIEFNNQADNLECIYVTELDLNVVYLKKQDEDWKQDFGFKKTIKVSLKLEEPKIVVSQNYVGLLINKDESSPNLLLWQKNNDDYIYSILALVDSNQNKLQQNYQIFIENIHLREGQNSTYLDTIYLQKNFSDDYYKIYQNLILQTFEIGQFSISLDKELIDLNGIQLQFQRLKPQDVIVQQLFIKSDEYKKVILHTAIVILLLLLVVLGMVTQGVWTKNNELRDELKKDLRERDLASERV